MINRYFSFNDDITELAAAAFYGDAELVFKLLVMGNRENPNQYTISGYTPLYIAVKNNNVDVVKTLLANGANPNFPCRDGDTPLCAAIKNTMMLDVLLAQANIDVNQEREDGKFPLYLAAEGGQVYAVKKLMEKNADPTKTVNGVTPRSAAIERDDALAESITTLLPDSRTLMRKVIEMFPNKIQSKMIERPHTQTYMIRVAESFGHTHIHSGICHGVASMAMQAMLIDERDQSGNLINMFRFNKRLQRLSQISVEKINRNLERIKQKRVETLKKYKSIVPLLGTAELEEELVTRNLDKKARDANLTIKQKRQLLLDALIDEQLTKNERIDAEIPAFFDGVVLYHHGSNYSYLFEKNKRPDNQEINPSAQILMSQKLYDQNGIDCLGRFSGIYSQVELLAYFAGLRESFKRNSHFKHPVAMLLGNVNHAISVGYDPLNDIWMLTDANRIQSAVFSNDTQLVQCVSRAFSSSGNTVAISTQLFVANNSSSALKDAHIIDNWKNQPDWKKMHVVTKEKSRMKDAQGGDWEKVALDMGQVDVVKALQNTGGFVRRHKTLLLVTTVLALAVIAGVGVVSGIGSFGIVPVLVGGGLFALEVGGSGPLIGLAVNLIGRYKANRIAENNKIPMTAEMLTHDAAKKVTAEIQQHTELHLDDISTKSIVSVLSINDAINKLPNEADRIKFRQTQPVDMSAISPSNNLPLFGSGVATKPVVPVVKDVMMANGPTQSAR